MENEASAHVTTIRFEVAPDDPSFAEKIYPLAVCYQRAYGYSNAWNEGMKCETCTKPGQPVKFNFSENRTHCDKHHKLVEFWSIQDIIEDLRVNLQKTGAVCVIAQLDNRVLGGTLAFAQSPEDMEKYLDLPNLALKLRQLFPEQEIFFYLAELFTDPDFEGRGVGSKLFKSRHDFLMMCKVNVHIFRTKRGGEKNPSGTYTWYRRKFGFEVTAQYNDVDDRVILAQTTTIINNRLEESEK
jgi:GNAT superfamily N-acetyltransferase